MNAVPGLRDPEPANEHEYQQHHPLVARHRAHLLQFLVGKLRCVRRVRDLRRIDPVDEQRHEEQRQNARDDRSQHPLRIGQLELGGVEREFRDQHVRGLAGEEHRAGDDVALVRRHHEERAQPACGGTRRRVVRLGQAAHDGEEDAARPGAVGRDNGGKDRVGGDQRVRQA